MQAPFRYREQFDLFQLWSKKCAGRAMPARADLGAGELRAWLGSVHLIEVIEGGRDFRYLIFGTDIARMYDVEMTRRLVSEWPEAMRHAAFMTYQRVVHEACAYLVRQNEIAHDRLFSNHRLVLPLSNQGTAVDHILTHLRAVPGNQDETGIHYHALTQPRKA
jgi:hypothetical protein